VFDDDDDDDDDDVIMVNQIFYGKILIQLQLLYKSSKGTRILFSKEKFLVQWLMGSSIFYFLLSRTKSYLSIHRGIQINWYRFSLFFWMRSMMINVLIL
jgi:hypothetical protein